MLAEYSTLRRAIVLTARAYDLASSDVWLLATVAEHGGTSADPRLEMRCEGSLIRRSLLTVRPRFCTGGDRRGQRTPITLTDEGWEVAERLESERRALQGGLRAAA